MSKQIILEAKWSSERKKHCRQAVIERLFQHHIVSVGWERDRMGKSNQNIPKKIQL
jgi:hypothetical protein